MPQRRKMFETTQLGVDFWNDSCDPEHLREGVAAGAVGATSNPVIVFQSLVRSQELWQPLLRAQMQEHPDASEDDLAWLMIEAIGRAAAQQLLPVFEKTQGKKGKLSLQVDPRYYRSTKRMVTHGRQLADLAPNIMVKVPATVSGMRAMEELTAEGISINATVSFSVAQAIACAEAVERGWQRARLAGKATQNLSPCVTIMVGRVEDYLRRCLEKEGLVIDPTALPWSGPAVFKKAYAVFKAQNYQSRLLAAAYRHQLHWTELIGPDVVLSIPYAWWKKFDIAELALTQTITQAVDTRILNALDKIPDFRKVLAEEGLREQDFVTFGPTQDTLGQFLTGLDDLRRWIRQDLLKGA